VSPARVAARNSRLRRGLYLYVSAQPFFFGLVPCTARRRKWLQREWPCAAHACVMAFIYGSRAQSFFSVGCLIFLSLGCSCFLAKYKTIRVLFVIGLASLSWYRGRSQCPTKSSHSPEACLLAVDVDVMKRGTGKWKGRSVRLRHPDTPISSLLTFFAFHI